MLYGISIGGSYTSVSTYKKHGIVSNAVSVCIGNQVTAVNISRTDAAKVLVKARKAGATIERKKSSF